MNDKITALINKLEQQLKDAANDQFTDDAMNRDEYRGYVDATRYVIAELKEL